jgi:hypothetical protein
MVFMRIPLPGPFSMVADVGSWLGGMGAFMAFLLGIFIMPLVVCLALTVWMGMVCWYVIVGIFTITYRLVSIPFKR